MRPYAPFYTKLIAAALTRGDFGWKMPAHTLGGHKFSPQSRPERLYRSYRPGAPPEGGTTSPRRRYTRGRVTAAGGADFETAQLIDAPPSVICRFSSVFRILYWFFPTFYFRAFSEIFTPAGPSCSCADEHPRPQRLNSSNQRAQHLCPNPWQAPGPQNINELQRYGRRVVPRLGTAVTRGRGYRKRAPSLNS